MTAKRSRQDRRYAFRRTAMLRNKVLWRSWQLLEVDGPKAEAAAKELKEAEALLACRMRIIKIADRSDYGWKMIAEYENDELALDSDDEKKLARAEKEAELRRQQERNLSCQQPSRLHCCPPPQGDAVPPVCRFGAAVPVPVKIGPCY